MTITVEHIAEICHEANCIFCLQHNDTSHKSWADTPDNIKQSAIDGARFKLANPYSPPSASHENWLKFKENDGWVYGEVKDAEKKTHPCMVPYDQLPVNDQAKDYLFTGIVAALSKFVTA